MTDNKFTAMMREQERESEKLDRAGWGPEHAAVAADWRAMREAWEAMVKALEGSNIILGCHGQESINQSALTKARAK